ncbi:hypothetical protein BJX70DRAFT_401076 [Aspergillus crustosus]
MPPNPVTFETDGLYILLSDLGDERQFHWGFYLAKSPDHGQVMHFVNNTDTNHEWKFISRESVGVPKSLTLLVASKIAVMETALHEPLDEKLAQVSTTEPITCRVWLKRALELLDDEGFIKLKPGGVAAGGC